ncbi:carbohydrate ABC transporter permease [Rubrobacter tropicus]|uniref:carbohydrate ABC transporter permease n=1 Tax=Rubrobacter tropicus TaxID=2653851 RepID=UPI001A9DC693|nr:sugar ABC transporter permease [Rubrobacter tropicus]
MSSAVKTTGKLSRQRRGDIGWGYFFILPQLFGVLVFVLYPLGYVLVLSLLEWDGLGDRTFVGLSNYATELTNPDFLNALSNTVYYTAMTVPTTVILSLMAALALNKLRFKNFFRVLYFAPVVTSAVSAGVVWLWVYNPDFGLINTYLQVWFGVTGPQWMLDPNYVMPSIAIMSVWLGMGFNIVIFLAGLQGIPAVFYEAAKIDGANRWQIFWSITLPLLSPTTFFIFVIAIINSFQVFDQVFIMTFDGGPANSAVTMVTYLRDLAFVDFVYGRSSAVAVILFALILMFTLLQFRIQRRWVHYD